MPIEKKPCPSGVTSHHLPSRCSVRKKPVARRAGPNISPPKRLGEPLGEFLRFCGAPRPEHLDRRDLFAPAPGVELAEAVDDALIHHAPRLARRRHAQWA